MKTATAKKAKRTPSTKTGKVRKGEVKKRAERVIEQERAKSQKKIEGVEPIRTRAAKKPNFGERTALARDLGITPQTLYNREFAFVEKCPSYAEGMKMLPRRGGALKEYPNLTPYQQFCHRQLQEVKKKLPVRDCTPNEILITQNMELFHVDLYERQKQLEEAIVPVESVEVN